MIRPYYEDSSGITIYCGDAREILPTLPKVDLVLTDPPYGIQLRNHNSAGHPSRPLPAAASYRITGDDDRVVALEVLEWAAGADLPTIAFASPMKPWPGDCALAVERLRQDSLDLQEAAS